MSSVGQKCDKCGAKGHFAVICDKQRLPPNRKKSKDKSRDRHPKSKVNMSAQWYERYSKCKALLGAQAVQQFRLMPVNNDNFMFVSGDFSNKIMSSVLIDYKDIFTGESRLEEKLHLTLEKTVLPVRTVTLAVKEPLKKEIERLASQGILKPVDTPTDWVSSVVVVMKKEFQRRLDTALGGLQDIVPIFDDILIFGVGESKAEAIENYDQRLLALLERCRNKGIKVNKEKCKFRLSEVSFMGHVRSEDGLKPDPAKIQGVQEMPTPQNKQDVKRLLGVLNYLQKVAPNLSEVTAPMRELLKEENHFLWDDKVQEEFQRHLDTALGGLQDIVPIYDDILIFGAGESKAEAIENYDQRLLALLERCRNKGIKVNKEKCKFHLSKVSFIGHVRSEDGLKPDPAKIQGVQEMPTPHNKQDVKRLLGVLNYLQKVAPNLSEVTAPMRELLKEENHFLWDEKVQGPSFERVKQLISESPILKYFDPKAAMELRCDASDMSLGACLMQHSQPVGYASSAMTKTEVNLAQIEKELLTIVFGLERLENYVRGRPVKIETDHKPLGSIFKKRLLGATKPLKRIMLQLQKYDLKVTYKKESEMYLADTLSRAFVHSFSSADSKGDGEKDTESINVVQYLPVSGTTQNIICTATEADPVIKELKNTIREG
ncbi:Retrovirus-related Pol polyprotein from transposon 17.6 [Stylophora pistillata]|uniref:Retrovirus-related Pol polyprotein from transposon 17.6 n=1 Tax=Stylophora pistillata TaxID=50429 RepID=A0A2B4S5L2_STYPI|nr:Retrovirus-related Pol polyprotein from transposon 17.6 [Stylophora pistillata]